MPSSRIGPLVRYVTCVLLVGVLVWVVAAFGERALLQDIVLPLPGTQLGVWLDEFAWAATYGVVGAAVGSFIWYLLTGWVSSIRDWRKAGKRWLWGGIGVVTLILCTAVSIYSVPPLREGNFITYALFAANSIVVYYLITVFATPPPYKYSPLGAATLRIF